MINSVSHNITSDKVLFCYRQNDADSLEVAQYYAQQRVLESDQLLALNIPNDWEIDYDTYYQHIELPIIERINILKRTGSADIPSGFDDHPYIFCIILGYNVPTAVNYNGELLAIASRLHRLGHTISTKRLNHTYDRKDWRYFDDEDNTELYVTAVINGPTKENAKSLIDRSILIDNQTRISGKIVLDPYGNKLTTEQLEYQDSILDFINNDINNFGLDYETTIDLEDPYADPMVPYLYEDSFYWGWFTNTTSYQTFKYVRTMRVFCYNADDGPIDPKEAPVESGPWTNIGLQSSTPGYGSGVITVDAPGEDTYLVPRPFFYTLHRSACLGEAFLYSQKYVDWKIALLGDPLMVVNFPLSYTDESSFDIVNDEIIYTTVRSIENYLKYIYRLEDSVQGAIDAFLTNPSFALMYTFFANVDWKDNIANSPVGAQYLSGLMSELVKYLTDTLRVTLQDWLERVGMTVSDDFVTFFENFTSQDISNDMIYENGFYEIDFTYEHNRLTLEDVEFVIEFATDEHFTTIEKTIDSSISKNGWYYEKEPYVFYAMPETGLASNYSSRRVRYRSTDDELLTHGSAYYYRITSSGNTIVDATYIIV